MPDQKNTLENENVSPEYVPLEDRFARAAQESTEAKQEHAVEHGTERVAAEKKSSYDAILSKVKSSTPSDEGTIMQDASTLDQQTDRESQITHLIDLAMAKGVEHAVKVAQKAEDYYVLDQLHDRLLADDLHEALMSRGLIEE